MQRRHEHRFINAQDSGLWLAHMRAAVIDAGVDEAAIAAMMDLLAGPAARLVNDGAPAGVLREALVAAGAGQLDAVARVAGEHPRLLDQRGRDGVTLLWMAARRGRLPVVEWLVTRGADIELPGSAVHANEVMISPLCIAIRMRKTPVAQYLLDHGAQADVFCAAYLGDIAALRVHVAAGLANAVSPYEDLHPVTPLHHAVDGGSVEATVLLLDGGADVQSYGGRLLTSAANHGSVELVRLLLHNGARAADAESLGPVGTDRRIGELLVASGFNLNVPVRGQETLLTMACRADKGEHPQTIAALLDMGADPNAINTKGFTPLDVATRARFNETIVLLRAAGAR